MAGYLLNSKPRTLFPKFANPLRRFSSLASSSTATQTLERSIAASYFQRFKEYANKRNLVDGKITHANMIQSGLKPARILSNGILTLYAKCGKLPEARKVFDKMPEHDCMSWNIIISAYARSGLTDQALELFDRMKLSKDAPDRYIYTSILPAITSTGSLEKCRQIHQDIAETGWLYEDMYLANSVLQMYGKLKKMEYARKVFDEMPTKNLISINTMISGYTQCGQMDEALSLWNQLGERDIVSWTTMMSGFAKNGKYHEALELFREMKSTGHKPNAKTYACVLSVCAATRDLDTGREIHQELCDNGIMIHVNAANSVIDMYAKCGKVEEAKQVFDKLSKPDYISWNTMLTAYLQNCMLDEARQVFDKMPARNVISWTGIISGYSQKGQELTALKLFEEMRASRVEPNALTYACVISACANAGNLQLGSQLCEEVRAKGLDSQLFVGNSLIFMYSKYGNMDSARQVFRKISQKNVITWTAMISGYARNGDAPLAIRGFREMLFEGVRPSSATLASILPACAKTSTMRLGTEIHSKIIRTAAMPCNVVLAGALIDMYAKCGDMPSAKAVFSRACEENCILYNAMMSGYAVNGLANEAIELFEEMKVKKIRIDYITFIAILSTCKHAGLVDKARQFFQSMSEDFGIEPSIEHYGCMMDLLGRNGLLDEAEGLLSKMPFKPDARLLRSLIGSCVTHKNTVLGERLAEQLIEIEPRNPANYVLLSNVYAVGGESPQKFENLRKLQAMAQKRHASVGLPDVHRRSLLSQTDNLTTQFENEASKRGRGTEAVPDALLKHLDDFISRLNSDSING